MLVIILFVLLMSSFGANVVLGLTVAQKPTEIEVERVVYRELEVAPKGCECGHTSSVHDENGCTQQLLTLDGIKTAKSYKCFCKRYTGPEALPEYYYRPLELPTGEVIND